LNQVQHQHIRWGHHKFKYPRSGSFSIIHPKMLLASRTICGCIPMVVSDVIPEWKVQKRTSALRQF
jgi:hypothetical protein